MIKAFKRWLAKAAYDGLQEHGPQLAKDRTTSRLGDMLSDSGAAIVAFQIDNGFVVRIIDGHGGIGGVRFSGFTYCADHQAIADHIVSSAMKSKLGVQSDMFAKEKEVAVRHASTQARGLSAAQSRI